MYLDRFCIAGNLTKDPELKSFERGNGEISHVCEFILAINLGYGQNAKAHFLQFVAYDKSAETLAKWARKGQNIYVEGSILNKNYTDKNTHKLIFRNVLSVKSWQFTGKRTDNETPVTARDAMVNAGGEDEGFVNIPDGIEEQLPFA